MRLGLTSAILGDMTFSEVVKFLSANRLKSMEAMCWPLGSGDKRKFAGVTHIDVTRLGVSEAARINDTLADAGLAFSGLGYYPNPLTADRDEARIYTGHLRKVIKGAAILGVPVVNTFIGRDQNLTVAGNWKRFRQVWRPLVRCAEDNGVKIGIENCPMRFTLDEFPGGKNLATSPANWRVMFEEINSPNFGLNFDPSHLVLQFIDVARAILEFGGYFVHVHAKDLEVDIDRLYEVGVLADQPKDWHTPRIPGRGQVPWIEMFQALDKIGYGSDVTIEVEDPDFKSLEERQQAVLESRDFLERFIPPEVQDEQQEPEVVAAGV